MVIAIMLQMCQRLGLLKCKRQGERTSDCRPVCGVLLQKDKALVSCVDLVHPLCEGASVASPLLGAL